MAKVIKRQPLPPPRPAPNPEPTPTAPVRPGAPASIVREGAQEVKEKLRSDLSRWMRVRRFASVKPTMGCIQCDATGKVPCITCDGRGIVHVGPEAEEQRCATCQGSGGVSCVDCAGTGQVVNRHRKLILWVLAAGGLAWLVALWVWMGWDLFPAQKAKLLNSGGGGVVHGGRIAPGARGRGASDVQPGIAPAPSGGVTAPAAGYGGAGAAPGYGAPAGGGAAPVGGAGTHGGSWSPNAGMPRAGGGPGRPGYGPPPGYGPQGR